MNCERQNVMFDTWVATDALGRSVATNETAGNLKNKKVGMFYFMWHDVENGPIYDHNKIYKEGGLDAINRARKEGPIGYAHYWGEPYFGYYRSEDEWVIRKHAQMLSAAGIDFIFFDTSNGLSYPHVYNKIFYTFSKIREMGEETPQIVFFNGDNPHLGKKIMDDIWNNIYDKGLYRDLWFMWEGKPLILGNMECVDSSITDFFTVRKSWAFNEWTGDGLGKWPWLAEFPQLPGKKPDTGEIEQLTIASGFHATTSRGRSFCCNKQAETGNPDYGFELSTSGLGLAFDEQFSRANEVNPPLLMITGWNEWWAGRWENIDPGMRFASTYTITKDHPEFKHFFVDCFNKEYSRDLEPMRGDFGDNYYYQLVNNVRMFKGAQEITKSNIRKTIDINNGLSQWDEVGPEYLDTLYDIMNRDFDSFGGAEHYINTTGRNNIDTAKVVRDEEYIYFLVTTREILTSPEGTNWMNLFIDVNPGIREGWEGYKFVVNRYRNGDRAVIEMSEGGWNFKKIGLADIKIYEKALVMRIRTELLGIEGSFIAFDFKWADNSTTTGDIMEFMDKGDSAPFGRFNFRYMEK